MIRCYRYSETSIDCIDIIDNYESFNFNRSYCGIGSWSLVLDIKRFKKEFDIISFEDRCFGLVTDIKITRGNDSRVIISGIQLKGIARQRIVYPPSGSDELKYNKKSVDVVFRGLIDSQIISPAVAQRKIPLVTTQEITETSPLIYYSGRYSLLDEDITGICEANGTGWEAKIEGGNIVFFIQLGKDRTEGQYTNQKCVVSFELDAIKSEVLSYGKYDVNTGIIAGQGEGAARTIVYLNNSNKGISRYEMFFDARDINTTDELTARGKEKLSEYGDAVTVEVEASKVFTDAYLKNYDLGDIVSIKDEILGTITARITNIEEVYENGEKLLNLTFGYNNKGLDSAFKRVRKRTDAVTAI